MKHHFFNHFVSMSDEYFQNLCKWVFEVLIIVNSLLLKLCTSARAFRYSLKCLLFYGLNFSFISSLSFRCRPHHTRTTLHIYLQIIQLFFNISFSPIPYIPPPFASNLSFEIIVSWMKIETLIIKNCIGKMGVFWT